ncbi:MAG: ABC transporter ATP-binding protein [Bdellovibrionota bacterium]
MSGFLELKGLSKKFGETSILERLDLSVKEGEFLVLVGPSGCGKSTILRLIAGLEEPTEGEVWINGKNVTDRDPKDRHIAMVFQSYALYPHMNVYDNMAFGLRVRKRLDEKEISERVRESAAMLQLEKLLDRKPKHLSGGQRQRVALGRALVRKPKVFLFDEPLSNLDAHLRNQMRAEIRKLQQKLGVTAVYVTHDQTEATTMGDRIALLQGGKLQQVASPVEIYQRPANRFVAGFIGSPEMNFLPGADFGAKAGITVGVRPENVSLSGRWKGRVDLVENMGSQALVHITSSMGPLVLALVPMQAAPALRSDVNFGWDPDSIRAFDQGSGQAVQL